jgi:two-component system response regulator DevR
MFNRAPAAALDDMPFIFADNIEKALQPIRIMIVDNQSIVADALESLLSRQSGMVVVGNVATTGPSSWVTELNPDVAILGYRFKDGGAGEAARVISQAGEAKMIFITADESDSAVLAAIDAGASAVLYMSMASTDLISAVRTVAAGGTLISPQTVARILTSRRKTEGIREQLTGREREILILISQGASNRAIATVLGISYVTVRTHMRNMAGKLAAHSKLEMVLRAQQLELVNRQN